MAKKITRRRFGPERPWTLAVLLIALGASLFALSRLPSVQWQNQTLTWLSLLPPFVALCGALLTRRVLLSLAAGVLTGAIVRHGVAHALPHAAEHYFWRNLTDAWHISVSGFTILMLATVRLAEESGSTSSLIDRVGRRLRTPRTVQLGTFGLGGIIFFDDYANTMLIGPSMRSLFDRYGLSREKLAYLIDSTAAPVAGLALVSTWVGYEVGLLQQIGQSTQFPVQGYALLLQALPHRYYCVLALVLVAAVCVLQRDFAPMTRTRPRSLDPGQVKSAGAPSTGVADPVHPGRARVALLARNPWLCLVLPLLAALTTVIAGILVQGEGVSRLLQNGWAWATPQFWQATLAQVGNMAFVLLLAACIAALCCSVCVWLSGTMSLWRIGAALGRGVRQALLPLAVLYCAWALASSSRELATGAYLVELLHGRLAPEWLPVVTFSAAALTALATGTSWGTMALLLPAVLPLAATTGDPIILVATVAAGLDGAIFGDHCSPISDTTLLSSIAADCDVIDHTWTQLPYAICAMTMALLCYVAAAWWRLSAPMAWLLGGAGVVIILASLGRKVTPVVGVQCTNDP